MRLIKTLQVFVFSNLLLKYAQIKAEIQNKSMLSIQIHADGQSSTTSTNVVNNNSPDVPDFVPTHEWQEVLDGQVLPAGLHYRMDLTLEKKYAKLLDGATQDSGTGVALVSGEMQLSNMDDVFENKGAETTDSSPQDLTAKTEKKMPFFDADLAKKILVGLPQPEPSLLKALSSSSKLSKEELDDLIRKVWQRRQQEIEDAAAKMVSYADVIGKILKELMTLQTTNAEAEAGRVVFLLNDLEYHLGDIDNAVDFRQMGGFFPLVKFLNSSSAEIQEAAAWVLGSATKDIRQSQDSAAEMGAIPLLLQIAARKSGSGLRRKAIYALGAMLRHHAGTQAQFRHSGGSQVLAGMMRQLWNPLRDQALSSAAIETAAADELKVLSKVVALAGDLMDGVDTLLRQEFRADDWCGLLLESAAHVFDMAAAHLALQSELANTHEKIFQAISKAHIGGSCKIPLLAGRARLEQTVALYRGWETEAAFKDTDWSESIVNLIQTLFVEPSSL